MVEPAGLVLGAIPLVILALDKFQESLEFGRSYARLADTIASIRDEVAVQQILFDASMERMGLHKPTYVELEECLQIRSPEQYMQFMRHIREMADIVDELMVKLEIDGDKQTGDISSRVGWEWRRVKKSFSTKERKRMFDELQHSNNQLRALLPKPEVPMEDPTSVALCDQTTGDAVRSQACEVISKTGESDNDVKESSSAMSSVTDLSSQPVTYATLLQKFRSLQTEHHTPTYTEDVATTPQKSQAVMLYQGRSSNFGKQTRSLQQKDSVFRAAVPDASYANSGWAMDGVVGELIKDHERVCRTLTDSDNVDRGHEQHASPFGSDRSCSPSDMDSVISSEDLTVDLDEPLLSLEVSKLRSWLLERSTSEHFCRHLQHQSTHKQCGSSTSQDQSTESSPKTASGSLSPSAATSSCKQLDSSKRGRDRRNDKDKQQDKRRRVTPNEPASTSTRIPRLACLYNKHDPMMYRSNAQTLKKFEICGSHDFQNMNKLYEHLKRVHSDQPLQCPRCTRTDFRSSEQLQAHQTASEPCTLVSLNVVKRIKWIPHEKRIELQSAVSRHLRGGTDEDKWRFAYRWLFPESEAPCPYLQDPVISIVSSVVDDFEVRLRELMRSSTDLDDLESRIPIIRGQFLAQYGIRTNQIEQNSPPSTSLGTVSSTPESARSTTITPPAVADPDQLYLGDYTNHDQINSSSNHQPSLNVLPPEGNAPQDILFELPATDDPLWLQTEFADFDDSMLSWDPNHDLWSYGHGTMNDLRNDLDVTDSSKGLHGSGVLMQKESLDFP